MNFKVLELEKWEWLKYLQSGESVEGLAIKWMIEGFEEYVFVAEGKEGEGFLFLKEDEKEEGVFVVVEDSQENERYIRVMLEYRIIKESQSNKFLN